jgi:hypothetical protein
VFEHFLSQGSALGVVLLLIPNALIMEITRRTRNEDKSIKGLGLIQLVGSRHAQNKVKQSIVGLFGTLGGLIWSPIYIGLFEGALTGFASFVVLGVLALVIGKLLSSTILFEKLYVSASLFGIAGVLLTTLNLP